MSLPDFSMRQLLEAGVHFGHQAHRWNPKMSEYIFGVRNNIHILDLAQTVPMMHRALQAVSDTVAKGGRILFVGTKRQAQDAIADAAKRSAQYYVNSRWLGGTLTNWKTISESIKRLRKLDEMLSSGEAQGYTKKERLTLQRERDKLGRALSLYCDLIARAAIDGISRAQGEMGIDIGAAEKPVVEELPADKTDGMGFEALSGPRGVADDLKKLSGISPTIEKKLNDLGIFHYWQIASLNENAAHVIGEEVGLPGRMEGWIAQAKQL